MEQVAVAALEVLQVTEVVEFAQQVLERSLRERVLERMVAQVLQRFGQPCW